MDGAKARGCFSINGHSNPRRGQRSLKLVFTTPHLHWKTKKSDWLKDILDKAVKIIYLIKYQTLRTCLFNILVLCDKMGKMHKALQLHRKA